MASIPTHGALINDDIFQGILAHLEPQGSQHDFAVYCEATQQHKIFWKTCNSLARTCKTFTEPALNLLWKDLYDLGYLLQLLSAFDVMVADGSWGPMVYRFLDPIDTTEWERLQTYANRVRRFQHDTEKATLDPNLYAVLEQHCGGMPLFPDIQEAFWCTGDSLSDPEEVILAISPSLQRFTLSESHSSGWSLMSQHFADEHTFAQDLKDAVNLRSLRITGVCIDREIIAHLPQFSNLLALHLDFLPPSPYRDNFTPVVPFLTPALSMGSLCVLSLDGSLFAYLEFLSSLSAPSLRSLTMAESTGLLSKWREIEECCKVVSRNFSKSLRILHFVRGGSQWPYSEVDPGSPFPHLLPLTKISGLEELMLDLHHLQKTREVLRKDFLDGSAASLMLSMKNLRTVRIRGDNYIEWADLNATPTSPTLSTALEVFAHSPNLTVLWFDVECVISEHDHLPSSLLRSVKSLGLNLRDSDGMGVEDVALLLFVLFPNIDLDLCREDLRLERSAASRDTLFPNWGEYLSAWRALLS